jgi:hypothetical protein
MIVSDASIILSNISQRSGLRNLGSRRRGRGQHPDASFTAADFKCDVSCIAKPIKLPTDCRFRDANDACQFALLGYDFAIRLHKHFALVDTWTTRGEILQQRQQIRLGRLRYMQ